MNYCFGDIVIVDGGQIGVVVKSWSKAPKRPAHHEVYVRMYNGIKEYDESEMERYMVRNKYLDEQELEWQENALRA